MISGNALRKRIVVIGGGFCGTMLAVNLLRRTSGLSLAVIDSSGHSARGLAYGTSHDCHLLNVRAGNMSAFPDEPDHFLNWARRNFDSAAEPKSFLPRAVYGQYLSSLLDEAAQRASHSGNALDWIRDEALAAERDADGFRIQRRNGPPILAQSVVLALGNFPPSNLGVAGLAQDSKTYSRNPWSTSALENLDQDGSVLLIGSGLTAVDLALALHTKGFRGKIHLLSRHSLIPQVHRQTVTWPRFWNHQSPKTAHGLLRSIRAQAAAAAKDGVDWRAVMDSIRPLIQEIWQSLPPTEQRRFLRHARPYWEVHRHRVAPQVGSAFADLLDRGQVQLHAGRITGYSADDNGSLVTFRARGDSATQNLRVARVINCSGPETDPRRIDSPLLCSLFAEGLVRADALSLGLESDCRGALLDRQGRAATNLFAIGPMLKGRLWETTAVPELRVQAANLAGTLAAQIAYAEPLAPSESAGVLASRNSFAQEVI
jgi:uncharacterized NAD(P)/FAD-binding protein YdhS